MVQLISTSQLQTAKTCLVYGPTGSGKTRVIATAPSPVILATDRGCSSLKKYDIPMYPATTYKQVMEFFKWAQGNAGQMYETIGVDDLTETANMILLEEKPKFKNKMQAYGSMQDKMEEIIRMLRDWPVPHHRLYLICKQQREKDHGSGTFLYCPDFPGTKLGLKINYFFDEVYALFASTAEDGSFVNFFKTRRDGQYEAKTRGDTLDVWEPANLTHVYNKLTAAPPVQQPIVTQPAY